jgi:hypothetical protein
MRKYATDYARRISRYSHLGATDYAWITWEMNRKMWITAPSENRNKPVYFVRPAMCGLAGLSRIPVSVTLACASLYRSRTLRNSAQNAALKSRRRL